MDFNPARRHGKTYGKSNKAVHVHDLFEFRVNHNNVTDPTSMRTSSTSSVLADPSHADIDPPGPRSSVRSGASYRQSISQENVLDEEKYIESPDAPAENAALYDIRSSDEDSARAESGSQSNKRRRTTKQLRSLKPENALQSSSGLLKRGITPVGRGRTSKRPNVPTAETVIELPFKPAVSHKKPGSSAENTRTTAPSSLTQPKPTESKIFPNLHKRSAPRSLVQMPKRDSQPIDHPTPEISECLSDQSHHSIASDGMTPKRKRPVQIDTTSGMSSPSQLGMTSLNLTVVPSPVKSSPGFSSDESTRIKKPRRRLIDRLDAPSRSAGHTSEDHSSDAAPSQVSLPPQKPAKPKQRPPRVQTKPGEGLETESVSEISQNRTTWAGKTRTTYATQRSHLSDMADQLDALDVPSSQKSAGELLVQPPTSSLASQLELEAEESDDHIGAGKLKSIHELRQSGANKRFDREIDTLLDDVDTTEQPSKSLRVQALMRLTRRLTEKSFLRQFTISGRIQRLTSLTPRPLDLPTSILLAVIFSLVTKSEEITLDTLRLVLRSSTDIAPSLLNTDRSLARIVKERKENLSKATVNDLISFDGDQGVREGIFPKHDHIYPDLMALHTLDKALRKMIQFGDTSARFSTSTYTRLLDLMQSQATGFPKSINDPLCIARVETGLSLLELCSVMVDDANLHVSDSQYHILGNTLATIIDIHDGRRAIFEQNVLRVVVSLSNNKPAMCGLLANTAITDRAFSIVNKHFPGLWTQVEHEHSLDESKLDSIVLALGCLLNFAECDASLRTRLSQMEPGEDNYIAQLVSLFNAHVSKVDEAMTQEQSQVLVAFGYLSMLLCTLSLEPLIRRQITRLLKQKSFDDLCKAGETFFNHLRTLEAISEDDSSLSMFTARFSAILDTIRSSSI